MKSFSIGRWLKKSLKAASFIFILLSLGFITKHFDFDDRRRINVQKESSCVIQVPKESEIITDKEVWQVLKADKKSLKFFNAYLDTRQLQAYVRVNSNGPREYITNPNLYCQFWYGGNEDLHYEVVKAHEVQNMIPSYFNYNIQRYDPSYLILCPVEKDSDGNFPLSVSVTLEPCDQATNNLKIIDNRPLNGVKKEFGYCGKYLNYKNRSFGMRFIEWIHTMKILGNDKVFMYNRVLHPDVEKLMKIFEDKDMLELKPFKEPSGHKWIPYYASLIQINLFTDCFYKMINLYKYIVIIDVDEVLIPSDDDVKNWHQLMERITNTTTNETTPTDVYSFKLISFPHLGDEEKFVGDDIPQHNYFVRHIRRAKFFYPWFFYAFKSIIVPDRVEWVHQHEAIKCFGGKCNQKKIDTEIAQVSHYRSKVKHKSENYTIKDVKLWKIKGELIKDVQKFLNDTQYKP